MTSENNPSSSNKGFDYFLKSHKIYIIISLVIALLIGTGVGIYIWRSSSNTETTKSKAVAGTTPVSRPSKTLTIDGNKARSDVEDKVKLTTEEKSELYVEAERVRLVNLSLLTATAKLDADVVTATERVRVASDKVTHNYHVYLKKVAAQAVEDEKLTKVEADDADRKATETENKVETIYAMKEIKRTLATHKMETADNAVIFSILVAKKVNDDSDENKIEADRVIKEAVDAENAKVDAVNAVEVFRTKINRIKKSITDTNNILNNVIVEADLANNSKKDAQQLVVLANDCKKNADEAVQNILKESNSLNVSVVRKTSEAKAAYELFEDNVLAKAR